MASKCISELAQLTEWSAFLHWLDHAVVNQWSWKADSTLSSFCHTFLGVQTDFLRKSCSCLRSIRRGWELLQWYPAILSRTNCVDRWILCMCVLGITQIPSMYGSSARVHEQRQTLRGSIQARLKCIKSSAGQDRVCILYDAMMSIYPGDSQIYTPSRWVYVHISICIYMEGLR